MKYGIFIILIGTSYFLHGMESDDWNEQLIYAVQMGNLERTKRCIKKRANVHIVREGSNLLALALIWLDSPKVRKPLFRYLLDQGAFRKGPFLGGYDLLHQAAIRNYAEEIRWLLEKGDMYPDMRCGGRTALMYALGYRDSGVRRPESVEAVRALLACGADPYAEDFDGNRAIDYASSSECKCLLETRARALEALEMGVSDHSDSASSSNVVLRN